MTIKKNKRPNVNISSKSSNVDFLLEHSKGDTCYLNWFFVYTEATSETCTQLPTDSESNLVIELLILYRISDLVDFYSIPFLCVYTVNIPLVPFTLSVSIPRYLCVFPDWFRFIKVCKIGTIGNTKSTNGCANFKPEGSIKTIEFGASEQTPFSDNV